MNHSIVIDASVAIKRIILEDFTKQTRALFANCLADGRPVSAPPLLPSEVTNALYQRYRTTIITRRITEDETNRALSAFLNLPIILLSPKDLYPNALAFTRTNRLPNIYDSIYVVLAQMTNSELWTGDRRLLNSVSIVAPWVRFIGDYDMYP